MEHPIPLMQMVYTRMAVPHLQEVLLQLDPVGRQVLRLPAPPVAQTLRLVLRVDRTPHHLAPLVGQTPHLLVPPTSQVPLRLLEVLLAVRDQVVPPIKYSKKD